MVAEGENEREESHQGDLDGLCGGSSFRGIFCNFLLLWIGIG